jgi:hypothetical protein
MFCYLLPLSAQRFSNVHAEICMQAITNCISMVKDAWCTSKEGSVVHGKFPLPAPWLLRCRSAGTSIMLC